MIDLKINTIQKIPVDMFNKNKIQSDNIGNEFDQIYELQKGSIEE
jgi:hypothetical protein